MQPQRQPDIVQSGRSRINFGIDTSKLALRFASYSDYERKRREAIAMEP